MSRLDDNPPPLAAARAATTPRKPVRRTTHRVRFRRDVVVYAPGRDGDVSDVYRLAARVDVRRKQKRKQTVEVKADADVDVEVEVDVEWRPHLGEWVDADDGRSRWMTADGVPRQALRRAPLATPEPFWFLRSRGPAQKDQQQQQRYQERRGPRFRPVLGVEVEVEVEVEDGKGGESRGEEETAEEETGEEVDVDGDGDGDGEDKENINPQRRLLADLRGPLGKPDGRGSVRKLAAAPAREPVPRPPLLPISAPPRVPATSTSISASTPTSPNTSPLPPRAPVEDARLLAPLSSIPRQRSVRAALRRAGTPEERAVLLRRLRGRGRDAGGDGDVDGSQGGSRGVGPGGAADGDGGGEAKERVRVWEDRECAGSGEEGGDESEIGEKYGGRGGEGGEADVPNERKRKAKQLCQNS